MVNGGLQLTFVDVVGRADPDADARGAGAIVEVVAVARTARVGTAIATALGLGAVLAAAGGAPLADVAASGRSVATESEGAGGAADGALATTPTPSFDGSVECPRIRTKAMTTAGTAKSTAMSELRRLVVPLGLGSDAVDIPAVVEIARGAGGAPSWRTVSASESGGVAADPPGGAERSGIAKRDRYASSSARCISRAVA